MLSDWLRDCGGMLESVTLAVIGYVPAEPAAGVPAIAPVEEFRFKPPGSAPVSVQV